MYGGAAFASLTYGSTFGGVVIGPSICNVTDWSIEDGLSASWSVICDGDAGTVT